MILIKNLSKLSLQKAPLNLVTPVEKEAIYSGYRWIAGVDEVGRGPLAGPVVACACVFKSPIEFPGINDSKLLSFKKREELADQIMGHPEVLYSLGEVSNQEIDKINILQASLKAMKLAVGGLSIQPEHVLVDGPHVPSLSMSSTPVIKGDQRSYLIAAASIVAKVYRDALMDLNHKLYPEYDFASNKGYGTRRHLEALEKYGPCPIHRASFAPVKKAMEKDLNLR